MSKNVVTKGAAILMAAMVASRLFGYVREKAVTHYFGSDWRTGAFAIAFNLPDLIYYLLAGGALGAAFIPVLRRYLAREDVEGGHRLANSLFNLMLAAMLTAAALAVIFAPQLMRLVAPKYLPGADPPRYELAVGLTRVLMFQVVLMGCSALFTALLQCHDHFTWPAMGWSLYNLGIIVGALVIAPALGGPPERQIYGVALGVLLGSVILVGVQVPSLWRVGFRWRPVLDLSHPDVKATLRAWLPIMLALAVSQVNLLWLPINLGSYFSGKDEGLEWSIRLAQRFILVPFSIFGVSIATAMFPTMSTQALSGWTAEVRRTFSKSLSSVLFFAVPSTAGLMVLALPITRLFWKSGKFTEMDAAYSAQMLIFFAIGLIALCVLQIVNRTFFAVKEVRTPLKVGLASFVLNLLLCAVLMRTSLTYRGIGLGVSITFWVNALVLTALLRKKMGRLEGSMVMASFLRSLAAALLMTGVIMLAKSGLADWAGEMRTGLHIAALQVAAGVGLGGAVYLAAALLLKVPEAERTWQRIRRKLGWQT